MQVGINPAEGIDQIHIGSYLSKLCESLASSMIAEEVYLTLKVIADEGTIESSKAVSLGLIVTELVINAIRYAFPENRSDGQIFVTYEIDGSDWKLVVSDNGVGTNAIPTKLPSSGLGTAIVKALAKQLQARMEVVSSTAGRSVSITHATFTSRMPQAA